MSASQRQFMASFLVRFYPAAWRREYGDEVKEVLLARPISVRTVIDVVWSALGQRIRHLPPHTMLGLPTMAFFAAWCWVNVTMPETMQHDWSALIHHYQKVQPKAVVYPFDSAPFVLLLLACGAWTHSRLRLSPARCGIAAMQFIGYAGFPVMVLGVLMASDVVTLPGFTPLEVFAATYFKFASAWLWGMLGGRAARWHFDRRSAVA